VLAEALAELATHDGSFGVHSSDSFGATSTVA
jgi:hypothetical protein